MKLLDCGKVVNTHGIRGEVKVENYCDDDFFSHITDIFIGGAPYRIRAARSHKGFALLLLKGVETVEDAMALKGKPVTADRAAIVLPEGAYFYSDLYGFSVYDQRVGRVIGKLTEVRESPAAMLYCIDAGGREILVPAVPAFYRGVDFGACTLNLCTIEGMLPDED